MDWAEITRPSVESSHDEEQRNRCPSPSIKRTLPTKPFHYTTMYLDQPGPCVRLPCGVIMPKSEDTSTKMSVKSRDENQRTLRRIISI